MGNISCIFSVFILATLQTASWTRAAIVQAPLAPGAAAAEAGELASFSFSDSGGISEVITELSLHFLFLAGDEVHESTPRSRLFDGISLRATDAGKTFTVDSGNEPEFGGFVSLLTNNKINLLIFGSFGGGAVQTELEWFPSFVPTGGGKDFVGFSISNIALELHTITFDSPGEDGNGDGIWTDFTSTGVIRVYGQAVPEATAAYSLLCGAWLLMGARRRNR